VTVTVVIAELFAGEPRRQNDKMKDSVMGENEEVSSSEIADSEPSAMEPTAEEETVAGETVSSSAPPERDIDRGDEQNGDSHDEFIRVELTDEQEKPAEGMSLSDALT
jgi:hypothetical protein